MHKSIKDALGAEGRSLRFDYAKFSFHFDSEMAQNIAKELRDAVQQWMKAFPTTQGATKESTHGYTVNDRTYVFEMWGALADVVHLLPFNYWSAHLERLDVRQEVNYDEDNVDRLYDFLNKSGTSGRNLQKFNTKKRSKVGGRSAGGKGMAIGSHKSDFRMTVYRRGGEAGAVEFQLGGKRLSRSLDSINLHRETNEGFADWRSWEMLSRSLHMAAWTEASEVTSLSKADMLGIISGESLPPQDADEQVAAINRAIGELPSERRLEVFQQLQLSLFAA